MENLKIDFGKLSLGMLSNLSSRDDDLISLIQKMEISIGNKYSNLRFIDISEHLKQVRTSLMNKFNDDVDTVNSMIEMLSAEIVKKSGIMGNPQRKRKRK